MNILNYFISPVYANTPSIGKFIQSQVREKNMVITYFVPYDQNFISIEKIFYNLKEDL